VQTGFHARLIIKPQLVLTFAAALVFFTNLGVPQLWDEDEPRNAACAREMLERGDWVVPTFNYELRTQKPVLLYWLMMASYSLFGVNEFSARFPSAVLAVGTTLVTFHLGRLLFNVRAGMLAGLMMATCLMFGVAGRAATPDSCLIFFTSLSLLAFVWAVSRRPCATGSASVFSDTGGARGTHENTASARGTRWKQNRDFLPRRWIQFALIYSAMALAVLAKGPIGLALPVAIIGLFLLLVHQEREETATSRLARLGLFARRFAATTWSMQPLTIVLVTVAIAAPWYLLVGFRTGGEWTRGFFGTENLARFQNTMEGHSGPVVYYLVAILIGFFPWSIVLPAGVWFSVRSAFGRAGRHPSHLLLVCWAGIWIGLFSLASTKLPSYVLPAYPALALMTASFVDRWLAEPACVPRWLMHTAWGSLVVIGIGMAVGLPLAARQLLPGEELIGLSGLIPLTGGVLALILFQCRRNSQAIAAVAAMAILFSATLFAGIAVRASRHQNSESLIEMAQQQSGHDARFATFAHPESSIIYYARSRVERFDEPGAVARFISGSINGYIITNDDRWDELRSHLPADVTVVARQPRFLKDGEVLLLGRRVQTAAVPVPPRR
jgi:4-amino-4-deoxy-L-arabinose transferase-like glycosyltransferase